MRIKLRGKRWGVIQCPLKDMPERAGSQVVGLCDYENSSIFVADTVSGKEKLGVVVHELTHALKKGWTEGQVSEFSENMAEALWALGYRRIES